MKTSNKFFAELFGTFVLVFGGCGTALFGNVGFIGVAIAFGLTVVAMAYGIGHISGAHLNPAVSFGVWANGRMSFKEMLVYWGAQIIGGIIAGALLLVVWKSINAGNADAVTGVFASNGYGKDFAAATLNTKYFAIGPCGAFLVEALLTFVFLMVILGVTDSRHENGKFGGLAIGLSALFQGKCAAAACDSLGETGKGTSNYLIVIGIIETVALFTLVFSLLLLGTRI